MKVKKAVSGGGPANTMISARMKPPLGGISSGNSRPNGRRLFSEIETQSAPVIRVLEMAYPCKVGPDTTRRRRTNDGGRNTGG